MPRIELDVSPETTDTAVVELLAARTGLSKSKIKHAMTKGAVWIESERTTRRIRRAKATVSPPDRIRLYYDEVILGVEPPVPVLMNDRSTFSVWIKPPGLMSNGSRFGDHCAINRVIERALDRPTLLVHRLDQFAWGVMVLAHTKRAAANLSAQFQARQTQKIYHAIVHGTLQESVSLDHRIEGKAAMSHVTPLETEGGFSLVEVSIETGRKHQIRIHLSEAGYPIAGDRQYGSTNPCDLQLAAVELAFSDPENGEQLSFNLPSDQRPTLRHLLTPHAGSRVAD